MRQAWPSLCHWLRGCWRTGAGGGAAGSPLFKAIPYIVLGTFVIGLAAALLLRKRSPEVYQAIGRTVLEDTHERA